MKKLSILSALVAICFLAGCGTSAAPSVTESTPASTSQTEKAVELTPGPWQQMNQISVTAGPFYAQPSEDSDILLDLPEGTSRGPICLEEKDGWSHCVIGDKEGWLPSDRVQRKWIQKEALPEFLPRELQLLFAKAQSLYNAYYPGAQSSGIGFCDWDKSLEGEKSFYCADFLYPTVEEWKQALSSVFGAQLVEIITNPQAQASWPSWLEENGQLYFVQGDRGNFSPRLSFALQKAEENRILLDACALFIDNQPWQISQPIELVKGPEGWRFEQFITGHSDGLWMQEYEAAGNRYIEQEARTAELSGTLYSPAFLTPQQKSVYDQAAQLMEYCTYPEQWGFVPVEGDEGRVWIGDREYQLYEQSFDELWQKFTAVFADEPLAKLEESGVYQDWNGQLARAMFSLEWVEDRTPYMSLFAWDQFRPIYP